MSELALVIYSALDFGLKKHDERKLTDELQDILEHMLTYSGGLGNVELIC